MVRVLHVVHALVRGGLCSFIMSYYREIDKTKIQFDFVYFLDVENSFREEIEAMGGHCYKFSLPQNSNFFYREAKIFFESHKGEYSILHCHALFAAAFYGRLARKHGIKRIIIHSHSITYGLGRFKSLRNRLLVKIGIHYSTDYLACSEKAALFMFGKKLYEKGKVLIIRNAIDVDRYCYNEKNREKVRKEIGIEYNSFVIGHIGGFSPVKNHSFLIDVFHEIYKVKPNSFLILIGGAGLADGSTKASVEEKIRMLHLSDHVKMLGARSDVGTLLSAFDCYVLPSLYEGFGISVVEAQTNGLSCFISDVVPQEVDLGLCHFISLSAQKEEWANAIINCNYLRNTPIIDRLEKYNIKKEVSVLESFYLQE